MTLAGSDVADRMHGDAAESPAHVFATAINIEKAGAFDLETRMRIMA